ncbi:putative 4-hydroxy-4-methyl-2-oxoglutarate aldolase [Shewanella sp. NFH-SH190041]|uniref:putative 4-hydroxy-4-methyl-2-oxoglutarate aldolase n=1 Tax=Shewanella sp. NFH-SH190041 TaxID=2950245 RepID=UPI0021C3FBBF|nr:putative 4-hydroxy-4-methyl-2-oxoglutarate aldolase [Shewanella sp. NFH-SH190041]BDM64065.1 putative 4-hydroxy-4-methyl-2-oxoglutarate aldolase [Shewanella sp. NFH-SH190041]
MLDLLPDLCDSFPDKLSVFPSIFNQFGGRRIFCGQVVTVKCFEDNSQVKKLLAQPGDGKILLVDGGGSLRFALLGDMIAQSAVDNQWEGIVIYGAVRDVGALAQMDIGIQALGTAPRKTVKRGLGDVNIPVEIAQHTVLPDMYLYADDNGIAISHQALDLVNPA